MAVDEEQKLWLPVQNSTEARQPRGELICINNNLVDAIAAFPSWASIVNAYRLSYASVMCGTGNGNVPQYKGQALSRLKAKVELIFADLQRKIQHITDGTSLHTEYRTRELRKPHAPYGIQNIAFGSLPDRSVVGCYRRSAHTPEAGSQLVLLTKNGPTITQPTFEVHPLLRPKTSDSPGPTITENDRVTVVQIPSAAEITAYVQTHGVPPEYGQKSVEAYIAEQLQLLQGCPREKLLKLGVY